MEKNEENEDADVINWNGISNRNVPIEERNDEEEMFDFVLTCPNPDIRQAR